jgi:hypothetical protein
MASGYTCGACQSNIPSGFAKYDDKSEEYFCNEGCFETWAEDNSDDVIEFYKRMNVSDVDLEGGD